MFTVPVNATRQAVGDYERVHARIVTLGSTAVSLRHVSFKSYYWMLFRGLPIPLLTLCLTYYGESYDSVGILPLQCLDSTSRSHRTQVSVVQANSPPIETL